MEHTSDTVYEGRLIHESSYPQRNEKFEEIEIGGTKIDYYDAKNKVIHEIKKSDKLEIAHEWQLKYYIYILEQIGLKDVTGILEYPKLRRRTEILLSEVDRAEITDILYQIEQIIQSETAPEKIKKGICKNCSYFDFCFVSEET